MGIMRAIVFVSQYRSTEYSVDLDIKMGALSKNSHYIVSDMTISFLSLKYMSRRC